METGKVMKYMDHIRSVALAGVAIIVEKTRTYGPSWKKRGGAGAWFTTVRPWDRLEKIVDDHGGDVFAAVSADPSGQDGSALACIRDIRNYLILIEAEMVARGVVVADPCPDMTEDQVQLATDTARSSGTIAERIKVASQEWFPEQTTRSVMEYRNHDGSVSLSVVMSPPRSPNTRAASGVVAEALLPAQCNHMWMYTGRDHRGGSNFKCTKCEQTDYRLP